MMLLLLVVLLLLLGLLVVGRGILISVVIVVGGERIHRLRLEGLLHLLLLLFENLMGPLRLLLLLLWLLLLLRLMLLLLLGLLLVIDRRIPSGHGRAVELLLCGSGVRVADLVTGLHYRVLGCVQRLAVHRGNVLPHDVALRHHAVADDGRGDGHTEAGGLARLAR